MWQTLMALAGSKVTRSRAAVRVHGALTLHRPPNRLDKPLSFLSGKTGQITTAVLKEEMGVGGYKQGQEKVKSLLFPDTYTYSPKLKVIKFPFSNDLI